MKRIIIDLDETLSTKKENENYANAQPKNDVIAKLRYYKKQGYSICIFTARNMRTYDGNIGLINVHTLPVITKWLDEHSVPYDEIVVGKPWCGEQGFYVDDRAIRPNEFAALSESEIANLLNEQ
jgi:capsule biosynthesis phosphatase